MTWWRKARRSQLRGQPRHRRGSSTRKPSPRSLLIPEGNRHADVTDCVGRDRRAGATPSGNRGLVRRTPAPALCPSLLRGRAAGAGGADRGERARGEARSDRWLAAAERPDGMRSGLQPRQRDADIAVSRARPDAARPGHMIRARRTWQPVRVDLRAGSPAGRASRRAAGIGCGTRSRSIGMTRS